MIFNNNVPPYLGTHDPSIYSSGIVWIIANVEILKSVKQNKNITKVNTAQENKFKYMSLLGYLHIGHECVQMNCILVFECPLQK